MKGNDDCSFAKKSGIGLPCGLSVVVMTEFGACSGVERTLNSALVALMSSFSPTTCSWRLAFESCPKSDPTSGVVTCGV